MSGGDTNPDAENPISGHLCLFMVARTWFPLLLLDVFYFRKLLVLTAQVWGNRHKVSCDRDVPACGYARECSVFIV